MARRKGSRTAVTTAGWEAKVLAQPGAKERVAQYRLEVETGRFVEQLVDASGKTQREIAAAAHVPEPNLTKIKQGEIIPTLDTMARLAQAALGAGLELRVIRRRRPNKRKVAPIVFRAVPVARRGGRFTRKTQSAM